MKEIRLLIHLLKSISDNYTEQNLVDDELIHVLGKLFLKLHHISYYVARQKVLDHELESSKQKYEIVYKKLRAKYNMKEYSQDIKEICTYVESGNIFSVELIKLLLASLYCQGRFDLSAKMYARYYELINDPEALFFHGMSVYYLQQKDDAKLILTKFINEVNNSVANKIKYKSLLEQATGLL